MPGSADSGSTDEITRGLEVDLLAEVSLQAAADIDDLLRSFGEYRRQAVASGAGMTITLLVDALPLTITAMDADVSADRVVASIKVPLDGLLEGEPGSSIEFFATDPDAFADFTPTLGLPLNRSVIAPGGGSDAVVMVTGLEDMVRVNQAIGMLIEDGYHPEAARAELHRRARRPEATMPPAA